MLFTIKKIIGGLLMPLPLSLLLLLIAWLLLLRHRKVQSAMLAILGLAQLYLLSIPAISNALLTPLERQFPMYQDTPVDYVVVLGGGHVSDDSIPQASQLKPYSLYRLHEGIRIYDRNPDAHLVFSGFSGADAVPHAQVMKQIAMELGVLENNIMTDSRARDTAEEAMYLKPLLIGKSFALVTSASHMPRAMGLFQQAGLQPVPAPCEYQSKVTAEKGLFYYLPNANSLQRSRRAIHEYLGIGWAKLMHGLPGSD